MEDVAFRVLCAGDAPDFRTIAAFRKQHLDALGGLFLQILRLCREAGLVKLGHVAIDGTKLKANASKHKAMSYARMQSEEQRLKAEIEGMLAQAEAEDAAEDERYGSDRRGDKLPEALRHPESRVKKICEAMTALEKKAREEATAAGMPDPDKAVPDGKAQRNFTDPESQILMDIQKAFVQGYNGQAAVDHETQVIVAADVVQQGNDKGQLVPMVEQVCDLLGETPEAVSADAGYWTEADLERLEWYDIPAYVAPRKIRHSEWRAGTVLPESVPPGLSRKEQMAYRLRTRQGRAEYDKRKVTVEPVFGQIKSARGFQQFLLRGLAQVQSEWRLICAVHNLLKIKGSGWRPSIHAAGRLPMGLITA